MGSPQGANMARVVGVQKGHLAVLGNTVSAQGSIVVHVSVDHTR